MAAREQEAAAAGRTNRPRVLLPGLAVRIAAVGRSLLSDPPRSFWLVFFIFLYFFFSSLELLSTCTWKDTDGCRGGSRTWGSVRSRTAPGEPPLPSCPTTYRLALAKMSAAAQAPEPDRQEGGPGHGSGPAPEGSPQEEFDFSILFDYDYLKPIEGW